MDLTTSTEAHNSDTILGSMLYTLWEGTCDYLKRKKKRIFTGTSYNPCNVNSDYETRSYNPLNLKLSLTGLKTIWRPIQQPEMYVELEVPTIGPHTVLDNILNTHPLKLLYFWINWPYPRKTILYILRYYLHVERMGEWMGSDALHSIQSTCLPSSLLRNSVSAQSESSLSKFFPLDARPNRIASTSTCSSSSSENKLVFVVDVSLVTEDSRMKSNFVKIWSLGFKGLGN